MSAGLEQQRDIGKLWGAVLELRTALIGIDGNNGLRGEFRAFAEDMERRMTKQDEALEELAQWRGEASNAMATYLEHGRKATCYGVAALEEYKRQEAAIEELRAKQWETQQTELKKARLAMLGAVLVALITAMGTALPKLIELAGIMSSRCSSVPTSIPLSVKSSPTPGAWAPR